MSGVQRFLLSWIVLALLLTAGTSLADVDMQWLTSTVEFIRTRYTESDQFCAAVKIPESLVNQQNRDLQTLLSEDTNDKMQKSFKETKPFYDGGHSVVAAKKHASKHAEYHVLKYIMDEWKEERTNNFLLIYTYLSPCADKCAKPGHKDNILEFIDFMTSWDKGYALVFQKPYNYPKTESGTRIEVSSDELKNALIEVKKVIRHEHIFRCYKPVNGPFHCIRCFSDPQNIVDDCYKTEVEGPSAAGGGAKRSHSPNPSSTANKRRVTRDIDKSSSRNRS